MGWFSREFHKATHWANKQIHRGEHDVESVYKWAGKETNKVIDDTYKLGKGAEGVVGELAWPLAIAAAAIGGIFLLKK